MAAMIDKVVIRNYRSIQQIELPLGPYTALVGYNNSGKTNAISAIQWLLRKASLNATDFYDSDAPVEVEANISGLDAAAIAALPEKQQVQVTPFLEKERLLIRRTQAKANAPLKEITLHVWDPTAKGWTPNPVGIDNALGVILPEPIRIGAMEDAAEDSSKAKASTTIGKLLSEFTAPVRAAHEPELAKQLSALESCLSANGATRFAEFEAIETAINAKIADIFPGIGARLHFPTPTIDELIKSGTLLLSEAGGSPREFSSYGHGAQRSVQMALIRHLAQVRRDAVAVAGTTLLLIDEPELFLHPFAIEQVRTALKLLATNGYQVIFSTHSAHLVTANDAQDALLIRKEPGGTTTVRRRLREAIQTAVPNSVHQMEQLFTLGHSSQVLFADRVILTEGKTELRLLPHLYEAVRNRTLGQERTALVAQSGVNDTKKSLQILSAMDIPTRAIVDLDYALTGAIAHGFLDAADPDVVKLLAILARLATAGEIDISPQGVPRNGVVTARRAFELLAQEADAHPFISGLHGKLRSQQIWLWKNGAIEAELGFAEKNERAWANFQIKLEADGLAAACPNPATIEAMINWVAA